MMKIHFVYLGIILVLVGVLLRYRANPALCIGSNFGSGMLIGIGATLLLFGVLASKLLARLV